MRGAGEGHKSKREANLGLYAAQRAEKKEKREEEKKKKKVGGGRQ